MKIKNIIFDLDDTLYDFKSLEPQAYSQALDFSATQLDVPRKSFTAALVAGKLRIKKQLGNGVASSHNRALYFQAMLEELGFQPLTFAIEMDKCYWDFIIQNMKLRSGVLDSLNWLRGMKIKIAICTDLTAIIQHRKLKALGIENYVDVIVTSEEAGAEKPAPAIFELCLQKLHAKPEESLMLGDSLEKDIYGAENIGIKSIWFSDQQRKGSYSIHNFEMLANCFNIFNN